MIKLFRHRRTADAQNVTFCEPCGQVCTATCRADAHHARARAAALTTYVR
ncbi:hypothetical protein ACL02O_10170 [Micromonospora sp. MS34]